MSTAKRWPPYDIRLAGLGNRDRDRRLLMATTPATLTVAVDIDLMQIVRALLICEVPVVDIVETPIWWHLYHQKPYFRMLCDVEPFNWQDWSTPQLAREHFGLVE